VVRPTLEDLFHDKVFKYTEGIDTFYVPLWVDETTFQDASGQEVTILSIPTLPGHVTIDADNHIHIYTEVGEDPIEVCKGFAILPSVLVRDVTVFEGRGIAIPNGEDIYDVHRQGDVVVHLEGTYGSP
jgi:hypothetical protein